MPESPPAQPDADLRFAHYRVERSPDGSPWKLGSGAMGVTYKAFDERLRIEVALKVITPAQVDEAKAQALFLREARAAARVRHSNVASVVYLNDTPGNFFYAMEFIAGESLADWLRTRGALPPAMAIGFATQIARGLEAIHAQQIVHRDLKPANLMIVPSGRVSQPGESVETNPNSWQIKIIDFGLARGFGGGGLGTEADAQTIGFRGTALYASPEQCEERGQIDGRSDLYALGCILWEMLVGAPPFRARTHRELLNQHVSVPPPLERIAYLPSGLRSVLTRLLAKDPGGRFANADAVVRALENCHDPSAGSDGKFEDLAVTATHDSHGISPAPRATTSDAVTATRPPAKNGAIGFSVAAAASLIAVAAWFFPRGQPATPLPAVASQTPVVALAAPTAAPSPSPTPAVPSRKSIAVLPFENLSGRPEDAYLADGLQEEILNALARFRDLKVISRTSTMEYRGKPPNIREVGQRLGVGTVLEGSIRREGNTLRLTVQLIDTRDDNHLLATSYDRELTKVLDLQTTVARVVAEALSATITRQERGDLDRVATNNGDAYDRYLRAVTLFRRPVPGDDRGVIEPRRLLEEALRLDPNYADAYALLSHAIIIGWGQRPEDAAAAKQAYERAFASDPKLPEAQLARGVYAIFVTANLDQALGDLGAVVKLRPNSAEVHWDLGLALRRAGRMEEALEHFVRAWDLDPLHPGYDSGPITTLMGLRRFPEAIEQTMIHTARFPDLPHSYFARARLQAYLRRSPEPLHVALREHGKLLDPAERKSFEAEIAQAEGRYLDAIKLLEGVPDQDGLTRGLWVGSLYHAAGDAARAEQHFRAAKAFADELHQREPDLVDLKKLAVVQSMLGEHASALATVETARGHHSNARNAPTVSFVWSFVLVRAGRTEEGYAEVVRLLRVPFGSPTNNFFGPGDDVIWLLARDDPKFDELINHPPRL